MVGRFDSVQIRVGKRRTPKYSQERINPAAALRRNRRRSEPILGVEAELVNHAGLIECRIDEPNLRNSGGRHRNVEPPSSVL